MESKICTECGEPFVPERPYYALCPDCYRQQIRSPYPSRRNRQHSLEDGIPAPLFLLLLILVILVVTLAR